MGQTLRNINLPCGNAESLHLVFLARPRLSVKVALDLPRFRGEMRAWDQALWLYVMLSFGFVAFFGSAPGGAILPSRPAH
jgi:hypothetical protein